MRNLAVISVWLGAVLLVPSSAGGVDGFQSPSRNIGCAMSPQGIRCDIDEKSWSPPPKPTDCRLDWGYGVRLERRGEASFVCAGDTTLGIGPVLPYGETKRRGRFKCASRSNGVRCVNSRNGHGFLLSRQRVELF